MARSAQTDISISFILIETLYVYLWLGPWNFRIHFKQNFLIDQLIFFPLDPKKVAKDTHIVKDPLRQNFATCTT